MIGKTPGGSRSAPLESPRYPPDAHDRRSSVPDLRRPPALRADESQPRCGRHLDLPVGSAFSGPGSTGFLSSRSLPMSPSHLATALVVPLEHLRIADVEA
ncbi:MAG: hypothetical protein ACREXI_07845, partial [Caldimonas sp.]